MRTFPMSFSARLGITSLALKLICLSQQINGFETPRFVLALFEPLKGP